MAKPHMTKGPQGPDAQAAPPSLAPSLLTLFQRRGWEAPEQEDPAIQAEGAALAAQAVLAPSVSARHHFST